LPRTAAGAGLAVVAFAVACGSSRPAVRAGEDVGQATAAIGLIPAQVACVEIDVAGARQVVRRFDAIAGAPLALSLTALPLGADTFTGLAYPVACDSVMSPRQATWMSDPVQVTLALQVVADVSLQLHVNGQATVGVGFDDDGGAGDTEGGPVTSPMVDAGSEGGVCSPDYTSACSNVGCGLAVDNCGNPVDCRGYPLPHSPGCTRTAFATSLFASATQNSQMAASYAQDGDRCTQWRSGQPAAQAWGSATFWCQSPPCYANKIGYLSAMDLSGPVSITAYSINGDCASDADCGGPCISGGRSACIALHCGCNIGAVVMQNEDNNKYYEMDILPTDLASSGVELLVTQSPAVVGFAEVEFLSCK
jgi:hypothetical protein